MSDQIFIDGSPYIPLNAAAKEAALSSDYISRLCKSGKIRCSQVGSKKYVSENSLREFIVTHNYELALRKQKLAEEYAAAYSTGSEVEPAPTRVPAPVAKHAYSMIAAARSRDRAATRSLIKKEPQSVLLSPATLLHKSLALALSLSLVFGAYAAVDPTIVRFASESMRETKGAITGAIRNADAMSLRAQTQLAAAAEDPEGTFASLWQIVPNLARAVNTKIDSLVYGTAFQNLANDSGSSVAVEIKPFAQAAAEPAPVTPVSSPATVATTKPNQTFNTYPVVERVVQTERIVRAGGITEEYLAGKLQELDNKFSSQVFALSSISSPPASGGFTNVIAMTNKIDNLSGVTINNSTITGGSITNTNLSNVTVSGSFSLGDTVIEATSGGTGTSTAPAYGQLLLGNAAGGYDLVATSSLGIVSGGGGGTWGSITGTLADQTDLQTALDAKISFSNWYATTTDALDEGTSNLYFTTARGDARVAAGTTTIRGMFSGTSPITFTAGTGAIGINTASLSQDGALSSSDFTSFYNRVSTTSIDTLAELETLWGSINVLTETEIDASSELAALLDDETGTGNVVFSASPTFTGTAAFADTTNSGNSNVTGLSTLTGGFVSQASSSVVGNFTSTGIGSFLRGTFTGTTGTTTIASGQGFTIGGSQFVVQENSGRIGIGTASPATGLDVRVATNISGDLTISGGAALSISATGPINQTGNGQVTFAGNVDATNGLDVTTSNFTVGGSNFVVVPGSGNLISVGTLSLGGAFAASSTMQVTGASRFYSTLRTDNTLTAAGSGTGLSVTNNASIGGTLSLTGAGTFGSSLAVTGTLSAATTTLTGELSLSSKKITGLANPSADQDAANKTYVDSVAQGLDLKDSVVAATTANITLSGEQTIDGVAVVAGDRVLVKNQADTTKNGIYVVSSGAWSRSTDADENSEVNAGLFTFIQDGTLNASSGWVLTTTGVVTLGSTSLSFAQFSGAGQIVGGSGLVKSGNTFDVMGTAGRITANADSIDISASYIGQSSITTVGALTSGSLGSGFGNIDIGASSITAGVATFSSIVGSAITGSGNLTINGDGAFTNNLSIGGTLSAATTTFSGNIIMGGKKITGLADPTAAQEAATKAYVDAIAQGLSVRAAVRATTLADITLSGTQTIDGVALIAGDRVLVKNQTAAEQNGIYVVAAGAWSRSNDTNENSEVVSGMYVFVEEGTAQSNTGWSLLTPNTITLGTTLLAFTQFSGAAETSAGDGLTKSGNTINIVGATDRITVAADAIDIAATYTGQGSIVTVGALASGSITSGFGAINIGTSAITAGAASFGSVASVGSILVGGTATSTISGNSATSTFSGGLSLASGNVNLATGGGFLINNILTLSATTLGSNVVNSSLNSVGALSSGSITPGFGAINIGSNTLDAGNTILANASITGSATSTSLAATSLTLGRVPFITTGGRFTDSSSFTFDSALSRLTASYASSTALTASTGYFATASTSALTISSIQDSLLYTSATGAATAATISSPLTFSAGTLAIQDAAANGSTKGAASFTANDFDATSGNISIDYTNGQASSASTKGFLSASDFTSFYGRVSTTSIDTLAELETLWGSINVLAETEIDASSELAALLDDETGSGALVFAGSPTFTGTSNFASIIANASSTIGGGASTTGLTIFGGATTTGQAYFGSYVGIGTNAPISPLHIVHNENWPELALTFERTTPGSTYVGLNTTDGADNQELTFVGAGAAATTRGSLFALYGNEATGSEGQVKFVAGTVGGGAGTDQKGAILFQTNDLTRMTILNNGYVGVGTSTPGSLLSINGVTNFSPATSTFYSTGGINLTAGCFAIAGTCLSSGLSSSAIDTSAELAAILTDETGSGALVFAGSPTFTGTATFTSILSTASSTIGSGTQTTGLTIFGGATTTGNAYFAGNVGIGTSSPQKAFVVAGTSAYSTLDFSSNALLGQYEISEGSSANPGAYFRLVGTNNAGGPTRQGIAELGAATSLAFRVSSFTEAMRISSTGNVGIGTTTPFANLSVQKNYGSTNSMLFMVASSTSSTGESADSLFSVDSTGLTTIGNSTGTGDSNFQFASDTNAWSVGYRSSDKAFVIASSTNFTGTAALAIAKNGNTTIVGSGTTCVIGSGTGATSCTSDERLKTNIVAISGTDALDKLAKIHGVTFNWADAGRAQNEQVGVLAQQVLEAFPQLVGTTTVNFNGAVSDYYTVSYDGLVSPLISAVNELNQRTSFLALASTSATATPEMLAQGPFATATEKIKSVLISTLTALQDIAERGVRNVGAAIYATVGTFNDVITERLSATDINAATVNADTLCIGTTCVTEEQLRQLLNNSQSGQQSYQQTGGGGSSESSEQSAPEPVVPEEDNASPEIVDAPVESEQAPAPEPAPVPASEPAPESVPAPATE